MTVHILPKSPDLDLSDVIVRRTLYKGICIMSKILKFISTENYEVLIGCLSKNRF